MTYFIIKPIYALPSGSMQISDILLLILFAYLFLIITLDKSKKLKIKHIQYQQIILIFAIFICWTIFVNSMLSIKEANLLMNGSVFLLFNLITVITVYMYYLVNNKKIIQDVLTGVKLSVFFQFILSFTILTSGSRQLILFNNPNQLGYYGLIMITFLLLFITAKKDFFYVIIAFYLILLSNSSAAIIGMILVISIKVLIININIIYKMISIFVLGLLSLYIYINIDIFYQFKFISNVLLRFTDKSESVDLISGRGYGRIFEVGLNFLWGVGEGANERFNYLTGLELHSTFIGVFVSYGLIGLILFLTILYKFHIFTLIGSGGKNLLFIGMFFYWITHQGIRNSLLWILLTIFCIYVEEKKLERKYSNEKYFNYWNSRVYRF